MKIKVLRKFVLDSARMYWGLIKREETLILCSQGTHIEVLEEVYNFYSIQNYHKRGVILRSWPCDCKNSNKGFYQVSFSDYFPYTLSDDVLRFFNAEVEVGEGEIVFLSFPDFGEENEDQYAVFLAGEKITWNEAKTGVWLKDKEEYEFLERCNLKFKKRIIKNIEGAALIVKEEENPAEFVKLRKNKKNSLFKKLFIK